MVWYGVLPCGETWRVDEDERGVVVVLWDDEDVIEVAFDKWQLSKQVIYGALKRLRHCDSPAKSVWTRRGQKVLLLPFSKGLLPLWEFDKRLYKGRWLRIPSLWLGCGWKFMLYLRFKKCDAAATREQSAAATDADAWEEMDWKAMNIIYGCITNEQLNIVNDKETSSWNY